jgi:hypothetical protein
MDRELIDAGKYNDPTDERMESDPKQTRGISTILEFGAVRLVELLSWGRIGDRGRTANYRTRSDGWVNEWCWWLLDVWTNDCELSTVSND